MPFYPVGMLCAAFTVERGAWPALCVGQPRSSAFSFSFRSLFLFHVNLFGGRGVVSERSIVYRKKRHLLAIAVFFVAITQRK